VLLGCAIEGASGMTYADQVREAVLEPAAMTRTLLDVPEAIVPHRSRGYGTAEDGSWRNSVFVDLSDRFPAGGWLSTPADLARFGDALLAGELLSEGSVGRMWQEGRTAEGKPTAYGLGWRLGPDGCEVFHGGSSVGGSAYLYLRPASRTVVAFATNLELWNDPRHALARRLADAASGPGSCP
jgi:CubicO group peptidase (beta-lactamase class C family)